LNFTNELPGEVLFQEEDEMVNRKRIGVVMLAYNAEKNAPENGPGAFLTLCTGVGASLPHRVRRFDS
jgi:hypothetical protein